MAVGGPVFTSDWASSRDYWDEMLAGLAGRPDLRFLEIGCFEGQATLWLLEHVLTDPSSRITVVDPFNVFRGDVPHLSRFRRNVRPHLDRVTIVRGYSGDVLRGRRLDREGPFDFVYVDGSHAAADVLADAVGAWPLLKPGGLMCFDDYQWDDVVLEWMKPQIAVDAFVRCYQALIADARRRGIDQFVVTKAPA